MTEYEGKEGQRLFLHYFKNEPKEIKMLIFTPTGHRMYLRNFDKIFASKNIESLYGKNFKLPNLIAVEYDLNVAPFFDFTVAESILIPYRRLKFFDISMFRHMDFVYIEQLKGRKPNYSDLDKMYPNSRQKDGVFYVNTKNYTPVAVQKPKVQRQIAQRQTVCREAYKMTKNGRCIKDKNYNAVVVQKTNGQRQTVCYEGYRMSKNGRCIKDINYKTIVVPVQTPVTGDLIKFEEVVKAPSVKKSVKAPSVKKTDLLGDLIDFVPIKAPSVKKPVSGSISYRNYMNSRVDEF